MSAKQHYVSKFHLREFTDPDSLSLPDPWLWIAHLPDGPVKRRAPHNIGTVPGLFDGPGGLADKATSLEAYLAQSVESTAAQALREFCKRPIGHSGLVPAELAR